MTKGGGQSSTLSFTQLLASRWARSTVNNFIFAQFLGICLLMGVSKIDTAMGMGVAVIFVMGVKPARVLAHQLCTSFWRSSIYSALCRP